LIHLSQLEPQILWKHFEKLCEIPRPSKHEAQITAYIVEFAQQLGLETIVDRVGNVIIRKPATPGMEQRKGIILQGHLDMVPQKNTETLHDFTKDPIQAYVDGDWVRAKGTTLGADNGMGVAAALALLESKDIAHGPLEALFTIDEETGMTGAFGLEPGLLQGEILLNLDTEDEGELYVGCAGGINVNISWESPFDVTPSGSQAYRVALKGLKGGHSGVDIHLYRGNSNKLLIRFLKTASQKYNLRLASFEGGSLRNAIPRESFTTLVLPEGQKEQFLKDLREFEQTLQRELKVAEPGLSLTAEEITCPTSVLEASFQTTLLQALNACPNGVHRMSDEIPGVVETSTNLGVIRHEEGQFKIQCLIRSSQDSTKNDLAEMVSSVFELAGAEVTKSGAYPGWKPDMSSPILGVFRKVYNDLFDKEAAIKFIHAGLECGLLGAIYPNLDMLSIGPTIRNPHSPSEAVEIASVEKFWRFLVEGLKHTPEK